MKPQTPNDSLARKQRGLLLRFGGMGLELAGGIVGFTLIGYWIDLKFNTSPSWLVTGATIGCIGGLYNLIRRAIEMQRAMTSLSDPATDESATDATNRSQETANEPEQDDHRG